jgi:hypothetical protein
MLPRAAPRPRAGACTLESSLRCLRTSDHRVLPGCVGNSKKIDLPPTMLDRRFKSRHLLTQRRACCPGLPRGPEQAPAPWSPPSAACAPRIIEFSGGCWKFEKIDLPPTMLDRRFKSRHLLTQRRACCPGLPRGPEQAPAPWSPPSAACATRIIELSGGCWKFEKIDLPPTMLDRRFKSRHLLTQRHACCPGLPRGPEQAPAPWSPPSAACAPPIIRLSGGCWKFEKIDLPRRCWTGASRAGICLPRGAHAAPGCPEAPSRRLHPGVLAPLPAHLGSYSSPWGVGNSRKWTSPQRCWTGASRAGICLPRGAHAAPGCPEAPSRRLHPGVLPPLPAHLGSSSSPGGLRFEKIDIPPTMLDRRFKSRHLLTQRRACCPGLPRGPEQAPAPWSPPSAACAPQIIELSGGLEIRENRHPPDDAGPALQEPASACPETRMLPRAAPRPRAGACTLESSLRCLRTSNHPALPWGVGNSRKSTFPRRCWTGASRAGICLPRGAHAAPGCPEAPSRRLHPGVLPPLPAHLGSSSSPPTMLDRRFKSRHLLTQRRACCPGLPRGPEQAPAPWSPPSAACAPPIIRLSGGCWKFEKIDLPRRCWTGASRAGICLPRDAHAAPGCPEAPSRRLHPGVLPPLPAHLRSYGCPGGVGNSRKSTSPDDAGPALQEPASACPETRMLPRAAPRPRAGACTLESSLHCLRTSDHRVLRGVLQIRENRHPPDDAGPALQEPASAYPEARMLPRAAPRPRAGACTLESSLRCLRTSDHEALPWGVGISRKSTCPRRCWTGASRAGICLPRGAHAAPGCPEAPSRRLHPGVLPPLPAHLGSSSSPGGVGDSRKSTSPRRCWTGASRAGICLPRGAHAAPGCPEAPSRRLHPGVLPPLPAHLRS